MTGIKQELEDSCIVIQNSRPFSDTGRLVSQGVSTLWKEKIILVGGLEHFFFPYIGNNNPNWLIFFRGVETTNQNPSLTWGLICLPSVLHNGTGLSYTRISREGTPLCNLWISADHLVHPVFRHSHMDVGGFTFFCRFLIGKKVTIIFGEHFLEWIGPTNKVVWVSNGFNILLPPGVSFHGRQLQRMISAELPFKPGSRISVQHGSRPLGPDPQAARTRWRMRHLVLCLCSDGAGGLEVFARRTGGGWGVLFAWAHTNWRPSTSGIEGEFQRKPCTI